MKQELKTKITKDKIIGAAIKEFGLHGFENGSINSICQSSNTSKGLVYHNFKNKQELYLCCLDKAIDEYILYINQFKYESSLDSYLKIRHSFFCDNPLYKHLIHEIILSDKNDLKELTKNQKKKFIDFNREVQSSIIDCIKLRDGVTKEQALEYYAALEIAFNSFYSLENEDISNKSNNYEKRLSTILNLMLYGIAQEEK
ncbi:MAG: TetR/AcrR family transcriptional regulator [Eubacterium sp.]